MRAQSGLDIQLNQKRDVGRTQSIIRKRQFEQHGYNLTALLKLENADGCQNNLVCLLFPVLDR